MPVSSDLFEQFERSIVRLVKPNGKTAGAGFLVESGYVVTCAHVVNAALERRELTTTQPSEVITLEFFQSGKQELAQVIGWHPECSSGEMGQDTLEDLAILKLDALPSIPEIPTGFLLAEHQAGNRFRAFGFAVESGRWAYGQLCDSLLKTGWIQLEAERTVGKRVEKGFSGTPVWDEGQGRIVGIVVAADRAEADRVAMAIPAAKVRLALRKFDVQSLTDILKDFDDIPDNWRKLYHLVKVAGYQVDPRNVPDMLQALQEMSPRLDLDAPTEPLLLFVVGLILEVTAPKGMRDRLTEWLDTRTSNRKALEESVRNLNPSQDNSNAQKQPDTNEKKGHDTRILVVVEPKQKGTQSTNIKTDDYRVWALAGVKSCLESLPVNRQDEYLIPKASFREEFPKWMRGLVKRIGGIGKNRVIEIFLPFDLLLNSLIDQTEIPPDSEDDPCSSPIILGRECCVVFRSTDRWLRAHQKEYEVESTWKAKWRQLKQFEKKCACQHLELLNDYAQIDFADLRYQLMDDGEKVGIRRSRCSENNAARGVLALAFQAGLPVVVWTRSSSTHSPEFEDRDLDQIVAGDLKELPQRLHKERRKPLKSQAPIAQYLAVLWDDPTCLPPPEALLPDALAPRSSA